MVKKYNAMPRKFTIEEYQLMAGIFEYMVNKGLGFCFTQDGRLIGRDEAKEYIVKHHGDFCNNQ